MMAIIIFLSDILKFVKHSFLWRHLPRLIRLWGWVVDTEQPGNIIIIVGIVPMLRLFCQDVTHLIVSIRIVQAGDRGIDGVQPQEGVILVTLAAAGELDAVRAVNRIGGILNIPHARNSYIFQFVVLSVGVLVGWTAGHGEKL